MQIVQKLERMWDWQEKDAVEDDWGHQVEDAILLNLDCVHCEQFSYRL